MAKREKLTIEEDNIDMKEKLNKKNDEDLKLEKALAEKEDPIIDAICPSCGVEVETHRCRLCGATKTINSVSGNVIWMRNGRIVKAFHDAKDAYVQMASKYQIPRTQWPEEFR